MNTLVAVVLTAVAMLAPATATASPVPLPDHFTVMRGDCPAYADGGSCADPATATIWLEPHADAFVFWHELGHLFDAQRLTDADRAWFTRAVGKTGAWFQGTGEGTQGPSELFADAYAECALSRQLRPRRVRRLGVTVGATVTSYGYSVSKRVHRLVCGRIRRVG